MNAEAHEVTDGEVISAESSVNQALMQITKGEIDQQIATAHQYPRSIAKFQKRALEMVTLDEETAESCIYARPVGKNPDGTEKYAEGMSIRMAEIVGSCYGNLRVGAMLIEMTERYVKARGFAHDLETNFASTSEVVESTVDKRNRPFSERMRVVVAKAALAKARRDATFAVVPKALCKRLEAEAKQTAIGDATTLAKRRGAVMQWVNKLGINPARVFAALNIAGETDIGIDQLTTLTGIKTAIKDGDITIDEAFPPTEESGASAHKGAKEALREKLKPVGGSAAPKEEAAPTSQAETAQAQPAGDAIPHFDKGSALSELQKQPNAKALDDKYKDIRKDFKDTGRELPIDVEAYYNDRIEHFRQKGDQLPL
jgi:hypothetical protein